MEKMRSDLIKIVGSENVSDDAKLLLSFSKDCSFVKSIKPWFVVKPQNTEQIEQTVKWANSTSVPLIPVSSNGPHYKGDTVPSVPQSVIVDLGGMKKVLSISRQQRMAVIEPGVTYEELQPVLAQEGLTLSTCLAPKPGKSVMTSLLEVEPRLNAVHQWMYVDPLRCMGVTWGDGITMFTGDAALGPKNLEAQWDSGKWQSSSSGPQSLDFFRLITMAQGSMGIVSWASVKCELLPSIHKMYMVPADSPVQLQDFVYRVLRLRFSDELFIVNRMTLASLAGETPGQIESLASRLPAWTALVGIAGRDLLPEDRVAAQEADIADIAQQYGLPFQSAFPCLSGETVLDQVINPCRNSYFKERYKGAFQDIFFITTLDRTQKYIEAMYPLALEFGFNPSDIGIYIQPQHCGTSVHLEFSIPYDPNSREEATRAEELYEKASRAMSGMDAYYSRPYNIWSHLQLNKDAQSYMTLKRLKEIFDPNNIMNTGKLTI